MPITETVLIQTNPLKINAHMSVIEALMILYVKECTSGERILNAIRRVSGSNPNIQEQTFEKSLLLWISHVCAALKKRIDKEIEGGAVDENGVRLQSPNIPPVQNFQDLCNGICLALLISYYCPKVVPWTCVRINHLPAVEDSIYNVLIVSNFSQTHLPYTVFHMKPEDITYMRGSMKTNLLVLLADLFNLFEIHPAKCVCYPSMDSPEIIAKRNVGVNEHGICHRRGLTMQAVKPIPDLRSDLDIFSSSPTNRPPFQVTRLTSDNNNFTNRVISRTDFRMTDIATNNLDKNQSEAFVVHKSRGITTLSSLHSQHMQEEPLVPARLRPNKEKTNMETKADEIGDYVPAGRPSNWEQNRRPSYAGRRSRRNSSSEDSQLTIENFGGSQDQLNMAGRYDRERDRERKLSNASVEPAVAVRSSIADARGTLQIGYDTDSGSEKQDRETEKYSMRRQGSVDNVTLSMANMQLNNTSQTEGALQEPQKHSIYKDFGEKLSKFDDTVQKPSYNDMPGKTNLWQSNHNDPEEEDMRSLENASKLSNIRVKLEEKRRRIEQEKRKIELALQRHQEKDDLESNTDLLKWETLSNESKCTPDRDPVDMEKYQQSIAIMNMNLHDIQQDIQRLATQQNQIHAQHLHAQQLIHAQHIANMLNQQQNYGSQQHLADPFQHRSMQQQQNFGSTPHLPQVYNPSVSNYSSRPPSRDPYQQMPPMPVQYINEHGQYMSPKQQPHMLQQQHYMQPQTIYSDNAMQYNNQHFGGSQYAPMPTQYINRTVGHDDYAQMHNREQKMHPNNMYMHDTSIHPPPTQRRTWAHPSYEQHQQPMVDVSAWNMQKDAVVNDGYSTWGKQTSLNLNNQPNYSMHQNGNSCNDYQVFPVHSSPQHSQHSSNNSVQRQLSVTSMRDNRPTNMMPKTVYDLESESNDDIMAPQSICFIGDEEDVEEIERNIIESMQGTRLSDYASQQHDILSGRGSSSENYDSNEMIPQKMNITSGNLTYRIPSPSRPSLNANSFQDPREGQTNEKGFYISFDDDQPKRPKPPLRAKRSPKKDKSFDSVDHKLITKRESLSQLHNINNEERNGEATLKRHSISSQVNNSGGIFENNNATYNKYTDTPINLHQLNKSVENSNNYSMPDRRNKDDMNAQTPLPQRRTSPQPTSPTRNLQRSESKNKALLIGTDVTDLDPDSVDEMERRKEKIMLLSLQRRQQQEEAKARKEIEAAQKREREREKDEVRARKKEEQVARRAAILEQHRLKKAIEEAEREGKTLDRSDLNIKQQSQSASAPRLRQQRVVRPRPKTIHVDDGSVDLSEASSISSRGKKGSSTNLTGYGQLGSNSMRRDYYRGSQDSLTVKEPTAERGRTLSRISVAKGSTLNFRGRKSNSLMNLCDTDSGLGRATPPRRAPSPGMLSGRHMPSPSGPGSLPPGLISKRRIFDDGSSDISPTNNSMMEYSGPKLYKQPAAKSNRSIILNAVEYCVFPGAVNRDAKQKVLEKIARSEAKHFLVLFRDAGCQFRALYSYVPETDQVSKLYGTGPSQVDEVMFDKFFKYNSGGKCFSQVHTKHLTVTIDAFTIHNSLWQGKKVHLPSKKDMALVI
ncbi:patronin isoform X4 [Teleopsis dalmanni]|uniref:patronin isoform X4 n=1 Tax=Teleopsis dalmanni TaxID=139649 RepID=UPI0018CD0F0E|nr:patronin isoform X4 [Teleopsis dalmanni]